MAKYYRISVEILALDDKEGTVEECGEAINFGEYPTEDEAISQVNKLANVPQNILDMI